MTALYATSPTMRGSSRSIVDSCREAWGWL
jgi:hypothetical protein